MTNAAEIVRFWREAGPKAWFARDDVFDARCADFEAAHHAAARRELDTWLDGAGSALALLLLLDQIPRNLYRDNAHAFATDGLAQRAAERAVAVGHDQVIDAALRVFFYMPFEHAEDVNLQARAVELIGALGDPDLTKYAVLHRDIIARFGRFPHRNAALGRVSTTEESEFLARGGFRG